MILTVLTGLLMEQVKRKEDFFLTFFWEALVALKRAVGVMKEPC